MRAQDFGRPQDLGASVLLGHLVEPAMRMPVTPQLVATPQQIANPIRIALGDHTGGEARRAYAHGIERVENLRQSVLDPAILCREVRRAVRLDVYAERNFKHAGNRQLRKETLTQVRRWFAALLALGAGQAGAQSAATLPASSDVYRRLEAVSAFFPVSGFHIGQRPLSRREVERLTGRFQAAIDSSPIAGAKRAWARREMEMLHGALGANRDSAAAVVRASVFQEMFVSDARTERVDSNGLGQIDVVRHAFGGQRHGWPAPAGGIATAAPTLAVGRGRQFALVLQPRFSASVRRGAASAMEGRLHRGYARAIYRNATILLGSDELLWGQSEVGSIWISENAPPLMAVQFGMDSAVSLPWLFRIAGPVRLTGLVADLGRDQDPPHTKLAAWQVIMQPWPRFEIAVAVLAQQGGKGGPPASLATRIIDLLPIIDALAPQRADIAVSNKLAGGNLRLRFPELSGLDVFYEMHLDDFDLRRFRSTVVDDVSHAVGLRLPLMLRDGQLVLRTELHNTGLRVYQHFQFRSGVTHRERLIGSPLGPNGKGFYLGIAWEPTALTRYTLHAADELRDPSLYASTASGPRDEGFRFIRITDDPNLRARRLSGSVERSGGSGTLRLDAGVNRAWRTGATARYEWMARISLFTQAARVF